MAQQVTALRCECGQTYADTEDVAKLLSISVGRVRNLASAGELPEPVGRVAGHSPLWLTADIQRVARERKSSGKSRPRRAKQGQKTVAEPARPPSVTPEAKVPTSAPEAKVPTSDAGSTCCSLRNSDSEPTSSPEHVGLPIEPVGRRFTARCACGWETPRMATESGATTRLEMHLSSTA